MDLAFLFPMRFLGRDPTQTPLRANITWLTWSKQGWGRGLAGV